MQKVLVTGASGMLGRYVVKQFSDSEVYTLGRRAECAYYLDLEQQDTDLQLPRFDLVVHCAGTVRNGEAMRINLGGTELLLKALQQSPPAAFVLISSMSVYGLEVGEQIDEEHPRSPVTEYGRSKYEAEQMVQRWCEQHGVRCTILRPAMALGDGVTGKPRMMFDAIRRGVYFNFRGNDARRSIVTAYDVARCVALTAHKGGVYNVCDGFDHTVNDLANAMGENLSQDKRVFYLPIKWAKLGVAIAHGCQMILPRRWRFPIRQYYRLLTSTLTFSNQRIREATGIEFFDTVQVTARRDPKYPYEHKLEEE